MKTFLMLFFVFSLSCSSSAEAQLSAAKDAQYIAVLRAVVNYKINDDENLRDIEKLRENQRFNDKVQRMLNKLSNDRSKNTTNRKVLQILEQAGQDIYKLLD